MADKNHNNKTEANKVYPVLLNLWASESHVNNAARPFCDCFSQANHDKELELHVIAQDTKCAGWKKLVRLIDEAAQDGREVFSPSREMTPQEWQQIVALPASIAKLTKVKHFILYGSNLIRIPPEVSGMTSLEEFTPYTSYMLHWFPYEILRCKKLKESTISTRALYGNYKYRPQFPKLPQQTKLLQPKCCSVCMRDFRLDDDGREIVHQVWTSQWIGSDVVPLLVHACSNKCIKTLPHGAKGYPHEPHQGGLQLKQPPSRY